MTGFLAKVTRTTLYVEGVLLAALSLLFLRQEKYDAFRLLPDYAAVLLVPALVTGVMAGMLARPRSQPDAWSIFLVGVRELKDQRSRSFSTSLFVPLRPRHYDQVKPRLSPYARLS